MNSLLSLSPVTPAGCLVTQARPVSQVPTAASNASVPVSVGTRQIVDFDGGGAGAAPPRRYRSVKTAAGTSATHPVIAV
jgi:hypothetical protein